MTAIPARGLIRKDLAAQVEHEVGPFHSVANVGCRVFTRVHSEVERIGFRDYSLPHGQRGKRNSGGPQEGFQLLLQSITGDRVGRKNDRRFCFREPGHDGLHRGVQFTGVAGESLRLRQGRGSVRRRPA